MTRLTEHFKLEEFACKCGCGFDQVSMELVRALEVLRGRLGNRPITVNSGCRCEDHNRAVGGAPNSYHLRGEAADIVVEGVDPHAVAKAAMEIPDLRGIGIYPSWTHVDIRDHHWTKDYTRR